MPYATAVCLLHQGRLLMASQNALRYYGRVAYIDEYRGLAFEGSEGDRLAAAMGDNDVAFLGAHGVIVTGPTVWDAFDDLYYLERAASPSSLFNLPDSNCEKFRSPPSRKWLP